MNKTVVVNLRLEKCDVKICRHPKKGITPPPQFGCFGNPFFLSDVNDDEKRKECIRKFKEYFLERIENDKEFRSAVLSLRGKKLGCFCKMPNREVLCHGDVYVEWLESH